MTASRALQNCLDTYAFDTSDRVDEGVIMTSRPHVGTAVPLNADSGLDELHVVLLEGGQGGPVLAELTVGAGMQTAMEIDADKKAFIASWQTRLPECSEKEIGALVHCARQRIQAWHSSPPRCPRQCSIPSHSPEEGTKYLQTALQLDPASRKDRILVDSFESAQEADVAAFRIRDEPWEVWGEAGWPLEGQVVFGPDLPDPEEKEAWWALTQEFVAVRLDGEGGSRGATELVALVGCARERAAWEAKDKASGA